MWYTLSKTGAGFRHQVSSVLQSDKCKANQNLDIQLYGSETESGRNTEINVVLWPLLACVSEVQETGVCPMQQFMDTVISCILVQRMLYLTI